MTAQFISTSIPSMDPRYQYIMAQRNAGGGEPKFSSSSEGEVPVIARVTDLAKWKDRTDVQAGIEIPGNQNEYIVTGRIPLSRFEAVRKAEFVKSLKVASQVFQPYLKETTKDIGLVIGEKITKAIFDQSGEGVVVGIVDFGCAFAHESFIKPNQKTRIHSIWEQAGPLRPESPYGYGRLYTREDINNALASADPYAKLGYKPDRSLGNLPPRSAHGTHVMDIAAGNGPVPGVASKAKIMFVDLSIEYDKKLSDSVCVIEAVNHIFEQAADRPCVVNLSLGQNGGAHDGKGLVEQALDAMVKQKPNRAVVIAAGNSYADKSHYTGTVTKGKAVDVKWVVQPLDKTDNELEIWYSGKDEFEVEIIYKGASIARIPVDANGFITVDKNGFPVKLAYVSHRKHDPNNGDNVFQMFQDPKVDPQGGAWILRLHGKDIKDKGVFHAWIERDDSGPSVFETDDPNYTIGSISTGLHTIVVGSYDAHRPSHPISYFSSAGPTRDGRNKPEISAPGHEVWAADSTSRNQVVKKSGTSMAAPAVTGLIARIFGQARIHRRKLSIDETRDIIISNLRKIGSWDARYGHGRIFATAILAVIPQPIIPQPVLKPAPAARLVDKTNPDTSKRRRKK